MKRQNNQTTLTLGCGLIRIGRVWGVDAKPVPTEKETRTFLESAFEFGIRFFDTAPAYGLSEARLGTFIKSLTAKQRDQIIVATKFGEHWDTERQEPFVNHTYQMLQSSFEKSLEILGRIDVLQLHKASTELLDSHDVERVFTLALNSDVSWLGASISDVKTGMQACLDKRLTYIQLPFNEEKTRLLSVIEQAKISKKKVLFNRPFAMGASAQKSSDQPEKSNQMIAAFKQIVDLNCPGVILTGTASSDHLKQNISYFESATHG